MQRYKIISHGCVLRDSKYVYFAVIFDKETRTYFRDEVEDCSTYDEFLRALADKLGVKPEDFSQ